MIFFRLAESLEEHQKSGILGLRELDLILSLGGLLRRSTFNLVFSAAATVTWLTEVEERPLCGRIRSQPGPIGKVGKGSSAERNPDGPTAP